MATPSSPDPPLAPGSQSIGELSCKRGVERGARALWQPARQLLFSSPAAPGARISLPRHSRRARQPIQTTRRRAGVPFLDALRSGGRALASAAPKRGHPVLHTMLCAQRSGPGAVWLALGLLAAALSVAQVRAPLLPAPHPPCTCLLRPSLPDPDPSTLPSICDDAGAGPNTDAAVGENDLRQEQGAGRLAGAEQAPGVDGQRPGAAAGLCAVGGQVGAAAAWLRGSRPPVLPYLPCCRACRAAVPAVLPCRRACRCPRLVWSHASPPPSLPPAPPAAASPSRWATATATCGTSTLGSGPRRR